METCGEQHPDEDITCDKSPHPYGAHMNWATKKVWPGLEKPPAPKGGRKKQAEALRQTAERVREGGGLELTGSPTTVRREAQNRAYNSWQRDRDTWLKQATEALHEVCQTEESFTLEKVWAKIPDTPERRIMAVVTKKGVREGWMRETHGIRINHEWHTADGATFLLGKFTPVYESLLH